MIFEPFCYIGIHLVEFQGGSSGCLDVFCGLPQGGPYYDRYKWRTQKAHRAGDHPFSIHEVHFWFKLFISLKNPITKRQRMMIGVSNHLRNETQSALRFHETNSQRVSQDPYRVCILYVSWIPRDWLDYMNSSDLSEPFWPLLEKFGDLILSDKETAELPNETTAKSSVSHGPPLKILDWNFGTTSQRARDRNENMGMCDVFGLVHALASAQRGIRT